MHLEASLQAWGTSAFRDTLKAEIARLGPAELPLQQGLAGSSYATDTPPQAVILSTVDAGDRLLVKAGLFYTGIIAGCSCADDPTPVDEQTEYCEVLLEIDKINAKTQVTLLQE
ncbi:MAG TPA: hypothetical protein PKH69_02440 [Thiobacillaceae bacterium]|nr:hypothetical protein [Thiobacillaceae bacterium]HNU62946.1 hypothetical protein [Thiobacillaceae bacterium]